MTTYLHMITVHAGSQEMGVAQENRCKRRLIEQGNAVNDARRIIEAATMLRKPQLPVAPPAAPPSRRAVRSWMLNNAADYESATALAEGANAALDLPQHWLDDEAHWVWDEAALAKARGEL